MQVPTASSPNLGSSVWGGGASGVIVYSSGPWVAGVLVNNVWSLGGTYGRYGNGYSNFLTQPFVNYNFGEGWYVTSSPIVTANWDAPGTKWTAPIGGGAGRVVKLFDKLKPEFGPNWQLRTQVTFIF